MREGWTGDDFEDLGRPSGAGPGPDAAASLAAEIVAALKETAGRLEVVPDEGEMAWLVRDDRRVSWFNLAAAERAGGVRREGLVRAFAELIRRDDAQRPVIEGLVVGRRYRLH